MVRPWRHAKGLRRHVLLLSGGAALGQGLTVLAAPLLTRLYGPQDFGVLAIYAALVSILTVVAALRYDRAIPLPADDGQAAEILVLSLSIVLSVGLICGLVSWLWGGRVLARAGYGQLQPYLWLFPVGLVWAGIHESLSGWAMRKQAFPLLARTRLSQSVAQVTVQISLGLLHLGPAGLIAGHLLGQVGGTGALAAMLWRAYGRELRAVTAAGIGAAARRYRRFPLLAGGSALLNSIGLQMPNLLLAALYGPHVAGLLAITQRVLGLPLQTVGVSVAQVYFAESARLAHSAPAAVPRLFWRTLRGLSLIGVPLVGTLALASPWLFSTVFGPDWAEAGDYARILLPMFLLKFVTSPTGSVLEALERQDLYLVRELTRTLLTTGAVMAAMFSHSPPLTAVGLFSLAGSASYVGFGLCSWLAIRTFLARRPAGHQGDGSPNGDSPNGGGGQDAADLPPTRLPG